MANFEGNINLNVETSEIEVNGKFKLTEDELDNVAGGDERPLYTPVDDFYTCDGWAVKFNPNMKYCLACAHVIGDIEMVCGRPGGPVNLQQGSYPF